jgi:hypothetical protein
MNTPPPIEPLSIEQVLELTRIEFQNADMTLAEAMGSALQNAIKAVQAQNKGGQITLSLKIKPGRDRMILIEPALNTQPSCFFVDARQRVFAEDPKQLKFDNVVPIEKGGNA